MKINFLIGFTPQVRISLDHSLRKIQPQLFFPTEIKVSFDYHDIIPKNDKRNNNGRQRKKHL